MACITLIYIWRKKKNIPIIRKHKQKKIRDNNINSNSVVQISHACIIFIVDDSSAHQRISYPVSQEQ